MQRQQHVRIKIPSDYIYISPIRAFIRELAQQLEFSPTRIEDIESTVDEICNNAIEHGSCGTNSDISIVLTLNNNCLEILVRDRGKCKEAVSWLQSGRLEEIERKMSPESERGHGIFLAKTLSDSIDMKPNVHGGTDVCILFFIKSFCTETC